MTRDRRARGYEDQGAVALGSGGGSVFNESEVDPITRSWCTGLYVTMNVAEGRRWPFDGFKLSEQRGPVRVTVCDEGRRQLTLKYRGRLAATRHELLTEGLAAIDEFFPNVLDTQNVVDVTLAVDPLVVG